MKTVRLVQPGWDLDLCDVEMPVPGANEVLIEVKAAGICHSDAHCRAGRSKVEPLPLTLGHEVAGVIAQAGPGVTGLKAGGRLRALPGNLRPVPPLRRTGQPWRVSLSSRFRLLRITN
jgi:D-arabinose 1-dehydrogenase-like Zn-dependent alcohol dehydrogenase